MTMRMMVDIETLGREFDGVPHNTLHDAVHQAKCVLDCFKEIQRC